MTGFSHERWSEKPEAKEWYTPRWIFDGLHVDFDLDPCSPIAPPPNVLTPARRHLTMLDDGLLTPWPDHEFVWLNPPYGKATPAWVEKLARHPAGGIALLFARTDARWFQDHPPASMLLLRGRVKFISGATMQEAGTPGAPSALMAYGEKAVKTLRHACTLPGALYELAGTRDEDGRR